MLHVNKRIKDSDLTCWKMESLLHDNWMSRRGLFSTQPKSKASSSAVLDKLDNFVHDKMVNSPEEMYSSRLLLAPSGTGFILLLVALSNFNSFLHHPQYASGSYIFTAACRKQSRFSIFGPARSLSPCAQYMLDIFLALLASRCPLPQGTF